MCLSSEGLYFLPLLPSPRSKSVCLMHYAEGRKGAQKKDLYYYP